MRAIGKEDIVKAFRNCNIHPGAVLMLHSDSIFLAQTTEMSLEERYALFFDAMDEVLGDDGTLVIPTFTYSATKGEVFSVDNTASTVGGMTDYFRKLPGVFRSSDPIFSVAARGRQAQEFSEVGYEDVFGSGSVFDLLDRYDAWLGSLAGKFLVTHTHFIEQALNVDYRHFKEFPYTVENKTDIKKGVLKYFVRDLERKSDMDLTRLMKILIDNEVLHSEEIGRFNLNTVKCGDFRNYLENLVSVQSNALIAEGALKQ